VVAAAIIIDPKELIPKIRDSKALNPRVREELYAYLISRARAWAVYSVGPRIIERINILNASLRAMRRAVLKLKLRPKILMVDGPHLIPELDMLQIPLINGDAQCPLIGAASILAKVTRDRIMERYHKLFPQYGFDRHKGYPTREHRQALKQFGPSPIHRRNFRGVGE
jgi:ribonuclease HII